MIDRGVLLLYNKYVMGIKICAHRKISCKYARKQNAEEIRNEASYTGQI